MYPKSFNKRSTNSLEALAKNKRIDYTSLSYKILFYSETNVRSHENNFLKKAFWHTLWLVKELTN